MTRAREDRGAVAVVVAILSVVLIGMAAFAADFGYAYAVKRQLSVSVDAAALAAAAAVSKALPPGSTCNGTSLQGTASTTAQAIMSQNDANTNVTVSVPAPVCTGGTGGYANSVQVTVNASQRTPAFFGFLFGADHYQPARSATAQVFVPPVGVGLRPTAACAPAVVTHYADKSPFVLYISKDFGVCGTVATGNWGLVNFLNQGTYGLFNDSTASAYYPAETCAGSGGWTSGGSDKCQTEWIDKGYGGPVLLPNRCTPGSATCTPTAQFLPNPGPGPGLADNTGIANADYASLVGQTIQVPVADLYDSGAKTLDVIGVVTLNVCAVKVKKTSPVTATDPAYCTMPNGMSYPAPPNIAPYNTPYAPGNDDYDNWLENGINLSNTIMIWAYPTDFTTSGTINGPGTCNLGDASCDFGTRSVRLVQ